jgi:ArsR family transcriptional regulator, virulence genes transcriptional regulator
MDLDLSVMRETAPKVSALMKILANENRLMILCQLVECERSVSEMAAKLEMRQAALSQQLALLRKDGLVKTRRDAQTIYYSLARPDLAALLGFLYETYCRTAPNSAHALFTSNTPD